LKFGGQLARLAHQRHGEILRRVELVPVPFGGEFAQTAGEGGQR
jgi:hypothetical protein